MKIFTVMRLFYLFHENNKSTEIETLAPPDCSNRLKPDSLLWSMLSMTVHPLKAP